jgi:hypothetical protein
LILSGGFPFPKQERSQHELRTKSSRSYTISCSVSARRTSANASACGGDHVHTRSRRHTAERASSTTESLSSSTTRACTNTSVSPNAPRKPSTVHRSTATLTRILPLMAAAGSEAASAVAASGAVEGTTTTFFGAASGGNPGSPGRPGRAGNSGKPGRAAEGGAGAGVGAAAVCCCCRGGGVAGAAGTTVEATKSVFLLLLCGVPAVDAVAIGATATWEELQPMLIYKEAEGRARGTRPQRI